VRSLKSLSITFLISFIFVEIGYSQTSEEIRGEYRKERRAMMQEMMKMLNQDQSDILKSFDQQIDPFENIERLRRNARNRMRITQSREQDGSISIIIHLKKKNTNIDISTKENIITVKSVEEVKTDKKQRNSHFSQSISIPPGYVAKEPVQTKEGLKISLVRKK
jgi:hypothetical protein